MDYQKIRLVQKYAEDFIKKFQDEGKLDKSWRFKWNRRKSCLGLCSYSDKTIQLSIYYANIGNWVDIKDTCAHEVAHALCPDQGHNYLWKRKCREIGANPVRCGKIVDMPCRYIGKCPICNFEYRVQRQLKNMNLRICNRKGCTAKLRRFYLQWRLS